MFYSPFPHLFSPITEIRLLFLFLATGRCAPNQFQNCLSYHNALHFLMSDGIPEFFSPTPSQLESQVRSNDKAFPKTHGFILPQLVRGRRAHARCRRDQVVASLYWGNNRRLQANFDDNPRTWLWEILKEVSYKWRKENKNEIITSYFFLFLSNGVSFHNISCSGC